MKQLRNIWLLTVKDLKLFAADRMALFFALLFPMFFVVLFNFVMGGMGDNDDRLEIYLATREPAGGMSHQIIAGLETKDDAALKPGEPKIVWLKDYAQAKLDVEEKRRVQGFIAFPEDFTEAVLMGYGTELEIIYNVSSPQAIAALRGMAQSMASAVGSQQVVSNTVIGLLVEQELVAPGSAGDLAQAIRQVLAAQGGGAPAQPLVTFKTEKVGEIEGIDPSAFVIPGYLVMFVFFTGALAAQQIVRERQNRTLERMLSASAGRNAILGGVFGGGVVRGLIQITLFWGVGVLVFKMDLGASPAALFLLSILTIIMASAFGVLLATLTKTEKSASSVGVLTSLILAPLGGCWWPLFITPQWMQSLAKITPHAWATTAFNKLLVFGGDFRAVVPEMLMLIVFAVAFGILAVLRFRTEAD